ncbi:conserved hypothetical protein [Beggiatoa sp. PS]|nr:conserved hypothetical protein [Beggiatoa sp. PS]
MEIILKRTLKIERYRIIAEVTRVQKRAELHAVLLLAQQKQGDISAKMVAEELLGNRPETVGKRLIHICVTHDLLKEEEFRGKKHYTLTETGQTALREEKIFIPERGTWEIWVTNDPLLPSALIQIKVFKEPQARNEINSQEDLKERTNNMQSLPKWSFEKLQGQSITPLADRKTDYRFDELGKKGEVVTPDATITATLTIPQFGDSSELRFSGTIDGKKCDYQEQHAMTFELAWPLILKQQNWLKRKRIQKTGQQVLVVSYDSLKSDQERASFHKDYPTIQKPYLANLGKFDNTIIKNVPIAPATEKDASDWVDWLLERNTNHYVLKGDFEVMQNEVAKSFPDYKITFPAQSYFAQLLRQSNPRAYWYLQAPLDWQI